MTSYYSLDIDTTKRKFNTEQERLEYEERFRKQQEILNERLRTENDDSGKAQLVANIIVVSFFGGIGYATLSKLFGRKKTAKD